MKTNNDNDRLIYYMTLDMHLKSKNLTVDDLPSEWWDINDYRTQTDILSEAMNSSEPLVKTKRYLDYLKKD